MSIDLVNRILDESEIMSKSFSDATSTLLRIGLSVRETQRIEESKQLTAEERKALGG